MRFRIILTVHLWSLTRPSIFKRFSAVDRFDTALRKHRLRHPAFGVKLGNCRFSGTEGGSKRTFSHARRRHTSTHPYKSSHRSEHLDSKRPIPPHREWSLSERMAYIAHMSPTDAQAPTGHSPHVSGTIRSLDTQKLNSPRQKVPRSDSLTETNSRFESAPILQQKMQPASPLTRSPAKKVLRH